MLSRCKADQEEMPNADCSCTSNQMCVFVRTKEIDLSVMMRCETIREQRQRVRSCCHCCRRAIVFMVVATLHVRVAVACAVVRIREQSFGFIEA